MTCGSATWPTSHTLVALHTTTLSQYRCSGTLGSDSRPAFATTEKNFDVSFRLSGGGAAAAAEGEAADFELASASGSPPE